MRAFGRVPFDQKFRSELPKYAEQTLEQNDIFHQAGPISFHCRLGTFPDKIITRQNVEDNDEVVVLSCFMRRNHEKFNLHSRLF